MLIEIVIENEFCPFSSTANLHYEKFSDGTEKCVENEIHFEIPSSWMFCRLGDLFTVCSSKRVLQSEWKDSGIPFYRAREIVKLSDNDSVDNELFISEDHYQKLAKEYGVPLSGDLMVSGVGTIGKTYIVKDTDKFYYKDASVLCFQNRTGCINSSYAKYLLESTFMQSQMHNFSKGSTVDTITISTAVRYLCILPPVKEQERIVATINNLLSLNNCIDYELNNLKALVTNAKSKILDLAIRGKLVLQDPNDEPASILLEHIRKEKEELIKSGKLKRDKRESVIFRGDDNSYYEKFSDGTIKCIDDELPFKSPKNWMWCELQDCCSKEIKRGRAPKYADEGNVLAFAQKCNRKTGEIDISTALWLDRESTNRYSSDEYMLDGDIVINSTGTGTLGRIGIYRNNDNPHHIPIVPDSHVTVVRAAKNIEPSYLFFYLKFMQRKIEEMGEGSTNQKELKPLTIQKIRLPIPPYEEQQRIVKLVHSLTRKLSSIEEGLTLMH